MPEAGKNKTGGELDISLIESSFQALAPRGAQLVKRFYEILFKNYPGVIPLFKNTTIAKQEKMLLDALVLVVSNIRKPKVLGQALSGLGERHQKYGAEAAHYGAVAESLLKAMAEIAGPIWNDKLHAEWSKALTFIANTMLKSYKNKKTNKLREVSMAQAENQSKAFNQMPIAAFTVNKDGKIDLWNREIEKLTGRKADEVVGKKSWNGFF